MGDMDQDTLRITLDALRQEAESAEARVHGLQVELEAAQQRLQHLRGAVQNLQFIVGDVPSGALREERVSGQVLPAADLTAIHGRDGGVGSNNGTDDESVSPATNVPPVTGVKRTPSTEWMIEVINAGGRAMTREEAFAAYEREKGIPESWTNPRTAMANALGRAVKRKLIQQLPGDRYAPLGFDPYADRTSVPDERTSGLEEQR